MERIVNRIEACRCGCGGRDPWHARSFKRQISDIEDVKGSTEVAALSGVVSFQRRGIAKFPWGNQPVVEVTKEIKGKTYVLGWYVSSVL